MVPDGGWSLELCDVRPPALERHDMEVWMNSRERVLLALDHKEPDRVPIDFGGLVSSLHHQGHRNLLEYLDMPTEKVPIRDMFQQIVDPAPALKERFQP